MSGAPSRPDLGFGGVEAPRRACIQHLLALAVEIAQELLFRAHHRIVEARREMALGRMRRHVLDRPTLGQPFHQPTIEDGDVAMAEYPESPPDTWRGETAIAV